MKKTIIILLCICFLCGCSSKTTSLKNSDFVLSDANITTKNIKIGSSSEDFKKAYSDIDNGIDVDYFGDNSNSINKNNINKIDYSKSCSIYISAICIDGECMSTNEFIKQNKIKNGIDNWFSENKNYLNKHTVIYKCLIFTFDSGNVSNIESYEKNYKDEL